MMHGSLSTISAVHGIPLAWGHWLPLQKEGKTRKVHLAGDLLQSMCVAVSEVFSSFYSALPLNTRIEGIFTPLLALDPRIASPLNLDRSVISTVSKVITQIPSVS